jgi:hypothetical protein
MRFEADDQALEALKGERVLAFVPAARTETGTSDRHHLLLQGPALPRASASHDGPGNCGRVALAA